MNVDDLNWEDVRAFAVASRSQSYRDAAVRLGTTHPTVRRRVAALEAATGLRLFQRDVTGLKPTAAGQALLEAVGDIEQAIVCFARRARGAVAHHGPIRATMSIATALGLAPAMAAFADAWPEIALTVDTRSEFVDLQKMEADVAIRCVPAGSQPDPALAGRRAVVASQCVYGGPDARCWIASAPDPAWPASTPFPDLPVRFVIPEVSLRLEACRLGMGMAVLPCFAADRHLPRRSDPEPGYEIWVLVHPDLRQNPRLKLFRDAMVEALQAEALALRG
jgi:DNA-binding transcriptional LysR family regulator